MYANLPQLVALMRFKVFKSGVFLKALFLDLKDCSNATLGLRAALTQLKQTLKEIING